MYLEGVFEQDHPVFGTVFASWGTGDELVFVMYSYAADISDIVMRRSANR